MGERFMNKRVLKQYKKTIPANSLPTEEEKEEFNNLPGPTRISEIANKLAYLGTTFGVGFVLFSAVLGLGGCDNTQTIEDPNPIVNPIVNPIDETSEETYRIMCETKIKQIVANSWEGSTMSDISIVSMDANDDGKVEFTAKVDGKAVSLVADFGSSISDADYYKDMYTELSDLSTVPVSQILTEAEYKVMVEEKLENIIKDYYTNKYSKSLDNFEFGTIDKTNGYVYAFAQVNNSGRFIRVSFGSKITEANNYKKLDSNFENATKSDVIEYKADSTIRYEITESTNDAFLNSVVTDPGFKTALEGVGITLPSGVDDWTDVATVVNVSILNNNVLKIKLVDVINQFTLEFEVGAALSPLESNNSENQVHYTTIKNKYITVVGEVKDFSTIDSNSVLLENNKDIVENFNKTSGYIMSFGD